MTNANVANGPLSHLRVLDLSRILAAPWAGQILADLGATVTKVERPGAGDDTRSWGPPFLKDAEGRERLWQAVQIIGKVESHLIQQVQNGKIAEADIQRLRKG